MPRAGSTSIQTGVVYLRQNNAHPTYPAAPTGRVSIARTAFTNNRCYDPLCLHDERPLYLSQVTEASITSCK